MDAVPQIAESLVRGHGASYDPESCRVPGCELTARYHGYCIKHWRRGMTEETQQMSPHPVKVPASDKMTEEQMKEAIRKCRTQREAAVALGLSPKSIGSVAARCKALGLVPPWAKAERDGARRLPAMAMEPKGAHPSFEPAPDRPPSAGTETAGFIPAPPPPADQPSPEELAVRKIAALREILRTLDILGDLAAACQVIGSLGILLGANVHQERNW